MSLAKCFFFVKQQWIEKEETAPKKPKTVLSYGLVIASVFWDSWRAIVIDCLQKGREYNANLLNHLAKKISQKKYAIASWQRICSHISYRDDKNQAVKVCNTFSRALFVIRLFSFPKLKKRHGGRKFSNNEEVESTIDTYFEGFDGSWYKQDIEPLEISLGKI